MNVPAVEIVPESVADTSTNIYQRKVALMQDLGEVGRGGKNPHLKNEYIRYQDLMDALRPLTAKHGIDVICEIADGPIGYVTLTNIDDPKDQIVQRWAPTDLPKDQGGSYLIKYALMKLFLIGDGEDPDKDLGAGTRKPINPPPKPATPPVIPPASQPVAGGSGSPTAIQQTLMDRIAALATEDRAAFFTKHFHKNPNRKSVLELDDPKAFTLIEEIDRDWAQAEIPF